MIVVFVYKVILMTKNIFKQTETVVSTVRMTICRIMSILIKTNDNGVVDINKKVIINARLNYLIMIKITIIKLYYMNILLKLYYMKK